MSSRSSARAAAVVLAVTALTSLGLLLLGTPSAVLFGGVLGGLSHALTSPTRLELPDWAFRLAQALVGVTVGALVVPEALGRMASQGGAIVAVTLGTLAISLLAGWVLARRRDVTLTTGVFALLAGGASGVVAVAHDLGADDRVVTVVQYLRVLVILLTMPLVTSAVFHPPHGQGVLAGSDHDPGRDLAFVVLSLGGGLLLARVLPMTTMALLGPMVVATVLGAGGWLGHVAVPLWLQWAAFALIGVQVGLRFTHESLRSILKMLPLVLLLILAMIAATAALGALLAVVTSVDPLTAYLATTPGGLFAVLVIAADSGSDVTYVMAAQVLRLLVILALLPGLARLLRRADGRGDAVPPLG